MRKNKKSQVWSVDFIAGLLIFIFVIVLSVRLLLDMQSPGNYDQLYRDGIRLSDTLLTDGSPHDWDKNSVVIPGLMLTNSTNRLDLDKLSKFDNISYQRSKTLLHIAGDYIFYFKNATSNIKIGKCVHGYNLSTDAGCNPKLDSTSFDDLIKIDRIIIYNSTIVTMEIYAWS